MRDRMRKALDFAIAKEREAEAFYKDWARQAEDPGVRALFAELAGVEHGHHELLSRVTPNDMMAAAGPTDSTAALSDWFVEVRPSPHLDLQQAMLLAMKREQVAVRLYQRLAEFAGETRPLFEALAREEATHHARLSAEYDDHFLAEN